MLEAREDSQIFLSRLFVKSYRMVKALNARYLAELGYLNFKVGHIMVMMNLKEEGTTAAEISKKVRVSKQAMSKLIQELIEMGFLQSIKHPVDQRASLIQKTVHGEAFIQALHVCRTKVESEIATIIGDEKLSQLHEILGNLLQYYESDSLMDAENDSLATSKLN